MKIAFLNKYQNKVNRGAETFVKELSRRLLENHEVSIISEINYVNFLKKKYDVIIPTNGRFQVILIRLITWLKGTKMIVSGQSGIGWDDKVNLLTFPDAFIALSPKAERWAKRFNPFINVLYIPNGVDLNRFTPKGEVFKVSIKKPIILAAGAFTLQKRLDLTIKAVSKLKNVSLLVAGSGGDQKEIIEELGKKLLGNRFELVSVAFDKMPSLYRSADIFTLPSASSEAFGNVIVEAMATNLPVIVTNDSIRKEIVGNAGLLVDPTNTIEYANALEEALKTDWRKKPRKQAEKFSWDDIAKGYRVLLEDLIKV